MNSTAVYVVVLIAHAKEIHCIDYYTSGTLKLYSVQMYRKIL